MALTAPTIDEGDARLKFLRKQKGQKCVRARVVKLNVRQRAPSCHFIPIEGMRVGRSQTRARDGRDMVASRLSTYKG